MRRDVLIHSKVYEKPLRTKAIVDDSASRLFIKWTEKQEDGDTAVFEMDMDKGSGVAVLKRSGSIRSQLRFDTAKKTSGKVETAFGTFDVSISTDIINLPSLMDPCFTVRYNISTGDQGEVNVFKIELL